MANIQRTAAAIWNGNLQTGSGQITSGSEVLKEVPYSFKTRFEQSQGTNPEELIAAAHAACYSMAFAHTLSEQGYQPQSIETQAVCSLESLEGGGFKITKICLEARGKVANIEEYAFKRIAQEAEASCPVSNALRNGLRIELNAVLL